MERSKLPPEVVWPYCSLHNDRGQTYETGELGSGSSVWSDSEVKRFDFRTTSHWTSAPPLQAEHSFKPGVVLEAWRLQQLLLQSPPAWIKKDQRQASLLHQIHFLCSFKLKGLYCTSGTACEGEKKNNLLNILTRMFNHLGKIIEWGCVPKLMQKMYWFLVCEPGWVFDLSIYGQLCAFGVEISR